VRAPALTWNEKEPDCSASIVPVESGSVIQDCVVEALHSTEAVPLFNTCNETVADEPLRRDKVMLGYSGTKLGAYEDPDCIT
jgi:hypothetical protein